ncbi:MAG TPA: DUF2207 domain-containing protein [Dermatophilaceae bacterium]|nr:DUF2207 domain-containing protein [Dermatophilaceae bacterium]
MRTRALLVLTALAVLLGLPAAAYAAGSGGERIVSFTADYVVQPDGSMDVTETLVWQFADAAHHGIQRYIRTKAGYDPQPDKYRVYELSDATAASPSGAPADLSVSELGAETRLRVGDPDRTVSGRQTYVLKYRLAHVVNGFDDHVELYWNVTGDRTEIPTDSVKVTVRGPQPVSQAACFYGAKGSTDQCSASPGNPATFTAAGLTAGQQVSVVAGFPLGAVTDVAPDLREGETGFAGDEEPGSTMTPAAAKALSLLGYGGGIAAPVAAAALMGLLVWKRGRDEQYAGLTPGLSPAPGAPATVVRGGPRPVAVQFAPPAGVRPGLVGTIVDEQANTIDVSATVVDLAVRGFLTIEETEKGGLFKRQDWKLTRLVPREGETLLPYEQTLLDGIFRDVNPVQLSDLKNKFAATLGIVRGEMYDEVVRRGWFRKSPERQRGVWRFLGMALVAAGFASGWFLGFQTLASDRAGGLSLGVPSGVVLAAGLVIAGLIVILLGQRMAAKTAEGSAVLAQSLGFKQYLLTAEARQIAFEEAQDMFSRYLPYAIVFGVADRWAKVFAEVAAAAAAAGTPLAMPGWYYGTGGFAGIADGVDSFSTMASGTFTSTPGSSGSSGFGGGGFSGGGGGGGGSSSW